MASLLAVVLGVSALLVFFSVPLAVFFLQRRQSQTQSGIEAQASVVVGVDAPGADDAEVANGAHVADVTGDATQSTETGTTVDTSTPTPCEKPNPNPNACKDSNTDSTKEKHDDPSVIRWFRVLSFGVCICSMLASMSLSGFLTGSSLSGRGVAALSASAVGLLLTVAKGYLWFSYRGALSKISNEHLHMNLAICTAELLFDMVQGIAFLAESSYENAPRVRLLVAMCSFVGFLSEEMEFVALFAKEDSFILLQKSLSATAALFSMTVCFIQSIISAGSGTAILAIGAFLSGGSIFTLPFILYFYHGAVGRITFPQLTWDTPESNSTSNTAKCSNGRVLRYLSHASFLYRL